MKQRKQETQRLIDENNQLRKQLNAENRHYYEDLLVYMRAHTLLRDDFIVEQYLLAILQDLIDAQQSGMNAQTYFGKDPERTGSEMLKAIPRNIADFAWFNLKLILMMFMIFWLPQLTRPVPKFDVGNLLIVAIISIVAVWGVEWIIGSYAFIHPTRMQTVAFYAGGGLLFVVIIGLLAFFKSSWEITLSSSTVLVITSLGLLVGIVLPFFHRLTGQDRILYFWSMFILLLGFLSRLPFLQRFMHAKIDLGAWQWLLYVGMVVVPVLFVLTVWWIRRRKK